MTQRKLDYRTEPLVRYLEDAAAAEATPGGGSVTAMAGALASTMASMAAGFTAGRDKFKDVEAEISEVLGRLDEARNRLLDLVHDDMEAYEGIMAAYRLPKQTDAEKAARAEAIRQATKQSLGVVESVLGGCCEVLNIDHRLVRIANPNLLSDVGVAAELALGAARAARINAEVNLAAYTDKGDAQAVSARVASAVGDAQRLAEEVREAVLSKLRS